MPANESKNAWIDQTEIKKALSEFFEGHRDDIDSFGRTVNQTFEAFVFAATISRFLQDGWSVEFRHPRTAGPAPESQTLRLKFSTRGQPNNYSYAVCRRGDDEVHIRHQLRVATKFHTDELKHPANVCLDVAVIKSTDLQGYRTDDYVANEKLITFGEAKHMTAFAELVANFVGLVHEMQPERLQATDASADKLPPFLYVSGFLNRTARGVEESLRNRKYDIEIYWRTRKLADACGIPDRPAPAKNKRPQPLAPTGQAPPELDESTG